MIEDFLTKIAEILMISGVIVAAAGLALLGISLILSLLR